MDSALEEEAPSTAEGDSVTQSQSLVGTYDGDSVTSQTPQVYLKAEKVRPSTCRPVSLPDKVSGSDAYNKNQSSEDSTKTSDPSIHFNDKTAGCEEGPHRKVVICGSYDCMRAAAQLVCQHLEEANIRRQEKFVSTAAVALDPEQPNNIRILLSKSEVGWCIGKGGKVMKDIRRTSGASTWIKEGDEAYPHFDAEADRVTEIQGRLEATLTCLEMILRVNEKFSKKRRAITLLCQTHLVGKIEDDLARISSSAALGKAPVYMGETRGDYRLIHIEGYDDRARRVAALVALKLAELGRLT